MSAPVPYFDVIRQMNNAFDYRLRLVSYACQHGLKATARAFSTTVPTVRKWLRRSQAQGLKGLQEHSRAPRRQPHQTPMEVEQRVAELRRQLPTFGSRRLIREFDLPLSHGALERIWHAHGLISRRRKKYQRKQDLAAVKATWSLFQQISADTKDLKDTIIGPKLRRSICLPCNTLPARSAAASSSSPSPPAAPLPPAPASRLAFRLT